MLVRLGCCVVLTAWVLLPHAAHAQNCAEEISRLMSKDTEKLTTRYNRVTKQIQEKGANPKLVQEECRIAAGGSTRRPEAVRLRQGPANGQHDRRYRPRPRRRSGDGPQDHRAFRVPIAASR